MAVFYVMGSVELTTLLSYKLSDEEFECVVIGALTGSLTGVSKLRMCNNIKKCPCWLISQPDYLVTKGLWSDLLNLRGKTKLNLRMLG